MTEVRLPREGPKGAPPAGARRRVSLRSRRPPSICSRRNSSCTFSARRSTSRRRSSFAHLVGVAEITLPILLVLGLGTRFVALGLLIMTGVIQLVAPETAIRSNFHLPWAGLALGIIALGPGTPLSTGSSRAPRGANEKSFLRRRTFFGESLPPGPWEAIASIDFAAAFPETDADGSSPMGKENQQVLDSEGATRRQRRAEPPASRDGERRPSRCPQTMPQQRHRGRGSGGAAHRRAQDQGAQGCGGLFRLALHDRQAGMRPARAIHVLVRTSAGETGSRWISHGQDRSGTAGRTGRRARVAAGALPARDSRCATSRNSRSPRSLRRWRKRRARSRAAFTALAQWCARICSGMLSTTLIARRRAL